MVSEKIIAINQKAALEASQIPSLTDEQRRIVKDKLLIWYLDGKTEILDRWEEQLKRKEEA